MVKIIMQRNYKGDLIEFSISGHAEAAQAGEDIVCAAVSAIVQTALFGLTKHLKLELDFKLKPGFINFKLNDNLAADKEVKAIVETMVLGLIETEKEYSKYINLTTKGGGTYV